MRAADRSHCPGVRPAAAMEHRQRPQINAVRPEAECQRCADGGCKFGVGDKSLGLTVMETEGDSTRLEPVVKRVEPRAKRGHRVVSLEQRRDVWRNHRHGIATAYAPLRQPRSESSTTRLELAIGNRALAVSHCHLVRIDERAALKELDGRERDVVRRIAVESGAKLGGGHRPMLRHGAGVDAPGPRARCISTVSIQRSNLCPTAGNNPAWRKPSAACREIDAALSEPPITAIICR